MRWVLATLFLVLVVPLGAARAQSPAGPPSMKPMPTMPQIPRLGPPAPPNMGGSGSSVPGISVNLNTGSDEKTKLSTSIEIVLFSSDDEEPRLAHEAADDLEAPARGSVDPLGLPMNHCPDCHSDLVYPVAWEESSEDSWRIERRCPNCEWYGVGDFLQAEVEEFDDALNDGTEDLLTSLRQFSRANMEADVETMIRALDENHIQPMDF